MVRWDDINMYLTSYGLQSDPDMDTFLSTFFCLFISSVALWCQAQSCQSSPPPPHKDQSVGSVEVARVPAIIPM